MDGPLACDAYDRGRKARSLVGRAVLYSSGFEESEVVGMSDPRATVRPMAAATPCNVCGDPCLNGFAVCQRTRECRRVYAQRRRAIPGCRRRAAGL
jgi:hypothetical protein